MPINSFENYPMSWKPSIDKTEKPIYKALARQLEQDIVNGVLLPGTKLPPQRELADYLDLNLSTISKAFKMCELKGLLSATVGSGTFVSYDALSNAYLLEDTKPKLIEMGATLPDHASYEPLMLHLSNMLQETDYEKWFGFEEAVLKRPLSTFYLQMGDKMRSLPHWRVFVSLETALVLIIIHIRIKNCCINAKCANCTDKIRER